MGLQMTPVVEERETESHQREQMAYLCQLLDVNNHEPETYSQKTAEYIPECGIYKIRFYFQQVNAVVRG